jgi:hypothetical protein
LAVRVAVGIVVAGVRVVVGVVAGVGFEVVDEVEVGGGFAPREPGPGGDPAATDVVGALRGAEVWGSTPRVR